jgi:agmatinase
MKKAAIIKDVPMSEADVVLLGLPYEKTVSNLRGASLGPEALCCELKEQVEPWDRILGGSVDKKIKIAELHLKKINNMSPRRMINSVNENALNLLEQEKFVIGLGGEHLVSYPLIQAINRYMLTPFTILQVDAHFDLRKDTGDYEESPRMFAHSTVMRCVHAIDLPMVHMGIRNVSEIEDEFIKRHGFQKRVFYWPPESQKKIAGDIIGAIRTKEVYLTIDIDGFDPSVMPATGTLEPSGIDLYWFMNDFCAELFRQKNVIGFDIVEVAGGRDFSRAEASRTAYNAALLTYHLIVRKFMT